MLRCLSLFRSHRYLDRAHRTDAPSAPAHASSSWRVKVTGADAWADNNALRRFCGGMLPIGHT
eukprot:3366934-Alexandrium_andersonii.AAC.1